MSDYVAGNKNNVIYIICGKPQTKPTYFTSIKAEIKEMYDEIHSKKPGKFCMRFTC